MHSKGRFWLCTINLLASWNSLLYNKNRKYADAERWKSAMPKLRKTLGDIQSETCRSLMRLIETQSKTTLARWAIGYARERYLPICQETCPGLWEIVSQCQDAVEQKQPVSHCKSHIRLAADMARCCTGAAEQAAARAVAVACATMQTPSNALGFLFYGAAAVAYASGGLDRSGEEYEEMAAAELEHAYRSLSACSVPEEKRPVRIVWNC